jgi:hypothetical protein
MNNVIGFPPVGNVSWIPLKRFNVG